MSRRPRHGLSLTCGSLPEVHHITSRGIGSLPLFRTDADRFKFLSLLAYYALEQHVVVHVFCLMTNHFHLLVEDPRGNLSKFMKGLKQSYARYFNDVRGMRGSGHVYKERFWNERVTSLRAYDMIASYILLNPLRCDPQLAEFPEQFRWSSALLHCSERAPAAHFGQLLEQAGGSDRILELWPSPSRQEVALRCRAQLEAFLIGDWIAPHAARCGRAPAQVQQLLRERVGMTRPAADASDASAPAALASSTSAGRGRRSRRGKATIPPLVGEIPRLTKPHTGTPLAAALSAVRLECESLLPAGLPQGIGVTAYVLWRYTDATARQIARAIKGPPDLVARAVEEVRSLRRACTAWPPLLWRLEWRLYCRLGAAPWRS